jgi:hypothetical protein
MKFGDRAFFALTPVAAVLFGGVFVHDHQIALALPFGFLLARYTSRRRLAYIALAVLAVPWPFAIEIALLLFFPPHPLHLPVRALAAAGNGLLLAEAPWQIWIGWIDGRESLTAFELFSFKLPTWFSLYALGSIAVSALRRNSATSRAATPPGAPFSVRELRRR